MISADAGVKWQPHPGLPSAVLDHPLDTDVVTLSVRCDGLLPATASGPERFYTARAGSGRLPSLDFEVRRRPRNLERFRPYQRSFTLSFENRALIDLHRSLHQAREGSPAIERRTLSQDSGRKESCVFRNLGCAYPAISEIQH